MYILFIYSNVFLFFILYLYYFCVSLFIKVDYLKKIYKSDIIVYISNCLFM